MIDEEDMIGRKKASKSRVLDSSDDSDSEPLLARGTVSASATLASVALETSAVGGTQDEQLSAPSLLLLPELSLNDVNMIIPEDSLPVTRRRRVAEPGRRSVTRAVQTETEVRQEPEVIQNMSLDDMAVREHLAKEVLSFMHTFSDPALFAPTLANLFGVDVSKLVLPEVALLDTLSTSEPEPDWSAQFLVELENLAETAGVGGVGSTAGTGADRAAVSAASGGHSRSRHGKCWETSAVALLADFVSYGICL